MGILAGTDADAELVVRGEAPEGADPALVEVAALARELRDTCVDPPAEPIRERQIAAIVAEASAASAGRAVAAGRMGPKATAWSPPARRGWAFAFRLAAIGLVGLVGIAGMAVAGVKTPAPIDRVLERIGITDDSDDPQSPDDKAEPSAPRREGGTGSARPSEAGEGRRASNQARRNSNQARRNASGGEPGAKAKGSRQTGVENSAPGHDTADEAQSGQTPPTSPGRSEEHRPEGAGPPSAPGSKSQGKGPTSPSPGNSGSASPRAPNENSTFGQDRADEVGAGKGPPGTR